MTLHETDFEFIHLQKRLKIKEKIFALPGIFIGWILGKNKQIFKRHSCI